MSLSAYSIKVNRKRHPETMSTKQFRPTCSPGMVSQSQCWLIIASCIFSRQNSRHVLHADSTVSRPWITSKIGQSIDWEMRGQFVSNSCSCNKTSNLGLIKMEYMFETKAVPLVELQNLPVCS